MASNDQAFEVGYYKTTSANIVSGEKRNGYGKFHVLLGKENGVWKILMDAANEKSDEGGIPFRQAYGIITASLTPFQI
jgi:hypothetical protein